MLPGPDGHQHDVIIVGGGAAGLSAALLLGRARRDVCVLDKGAQRNLPAKESHSYFTRDGTPPQELVRIGREELARYATVRIVQDEATQAVASEGGFVLHLASGQQIGARKLILASGVVDVLPDIPGVRELWGGSVFHCPYCHGYESRDRPVGIVVGVDEDPILLAQLMKGWSNDLVLFTNGRELPPNVRSELETHQVRVREERIARIDSDEDTLTAVVLEGGDRVERSALLLRPPQAPRTDLAVRLGCALTADGLIQVGPDFETSVPGVYAAGDVTRRLQQIVFAAAGGAEAAASANRKMLAEDWKRAA